MKYWRTAMHSEDIVKSAYMFRRQIKSDDPFILADKLDIKIIYKNYNPSVKGYCFKLKKNSLIFINSNYSLKSQKIICAHEIWHLIMHSELSDIKHFDDPDSTYEHEANLFAMAFLLGPEMEGVLKMKLSRMPVPFVNELIHLNMKLK
jgi:Zn-dependent peptidase ImmA (M78 family)